MRCEGQGVAGAAACVVLGGGSPGKILRAGAGQVMNGRYTQDSTGDALIYGANERGLKDYWMSEKENMCR